MATKYAQERASLVSKEEGDYICGMVLELMKRIKLAKDAGEFWK